MQKVWRPLGVQHISSKIFDSIGSRFETRAKAEVWLTIVPHPVGLRTRELYAERQCDPLD
jgi:hypothetical protein